VTDTLFATDASATAHEGEVLLVEIAGAEYALAPSTAEAFVDDLAAAVERLGSTDTGGDDRLADAAAEEFMERVDADVEAAPTPRERDPDAEWVMGLVGDDERLERIPITYECSECDFESETEAGVRRHQGMMHDSVGMVVASPGESGGGATTPSPLEEQIVETLDEHGELPSSEVKLLLETSSSQYYDALSALRDAGRVESRKDPDDKRRTLYSLTDERTDEHADGKDGVADPVGGDDDSQIGAESDDSDDADTDESGETYPYECSCGVTLHDGLEDDIHRTEEHGASRGSVGYLEPGEFEQTVEEAASPQDVADALGWGVERVLRALAIYGLDDLLVDPDRSLADINDFEFDGVGAGGDTDEQEAAADGGGAAVSESDDVSASDGTTDWTPGEDINADPNATGPRRTCQNCGTSISAQYVKVYEPDGVEQPRACPNCEDLVRDGNGVRETRT